MMYYLFYLLRCMFRAFSVPSSYVHSYDLSKGFIGKLPLRLSHTVIPSEYVNHTIEDDKQYYSHTIEITNNGNNNDQSSS